MNNKRLGVILLILGIVVAAIILNLMNNYNNTVRAEGCYLTDHCKRMESTLSVTHFAFGVVGFIIGLGFYLLFFTKEEAILDMLQQEKGQKIKDNKFNILMQALDPSEQKVLQSIKDQEGITQNTLLLKTGLSKAKISYVVNDLEKRDLITRVKKNKTFAIYMKANF